MENQLPNDAMAVGALGPCVSLSDGLVMLDLCLASDEHVAVPYSRIHVLKLVRTPGSSMERLSFQVPGVEVVVSGHSLEDVMHAMIAREVRELSVSPLGSIRRDKTCPAVDEIEVTWTDD